MNKKWFIPLIVVIVTTLISCKKEYTCECVHFGFIASETETLSRRDAEQWCNDIESGNGIFGDDGSCELK
jgi:hypothetical protein